MNGSFDRNTLQMLAQALMATNQAARQRWAGDGPIQDSDVYVSPFAQRVDRQGPVGPTGRGFGELGVDNPKFERPLPPAPDKAMIEPEMQSGMLERLAKMLMQGGI